MATKTYPGPLLGSDVLERRVLVLGAMVDDRRVPLAERAASRVLAGHPHGRSLEQQ